jgi:hypothetical protein
MYSMYSSIALKTVEKFVTVEVKLQEILRTLHSLEQRARARWGCTLGAEALLSTGQSAAPLTVLLNGCFNIESNNRTKSF